MAMFGVICSKLRFSIQLRNCQFDCSLVLRVGPTGTQNQKMRPPTGWTVGAETVKYYHGISWLPKGWTIDVNTVNLRKVISSTLSWTREVILEP